MFNARLNSTAVDSKLRDIKERLGTIAMQRAMVEAAKRGAVVAEANISPYPPQTGNELPVQYDRVSEAKKKYKTKEGVVINPGGRFRSKFKNRKQQGKVFILIRDGDVPYARTGTLGRSWTSRVDKIPGGARIRIGNNVPYAPLVVDETEQATYHQDNWTPIQEDIRRALPAIQQAILKYLVEYFS